MKKALYIAAAVLAAFAAGEQFGLWLRRPLTTPVVVIEGPAQGVSETKDAGALNDEGACELSWSFCWRRT